MYRERREQYAFHSAWVDSSFASSKQQCDGIFALLRKLAASPCSRLKETNIESIFRLSPFQRGIGSHKHPEPQRQSVLAHEQEANQIDARHAAAADHTLVIDYCLSCPEHTEV